MEKDYSLQCIDYAVAKTFERSKEDYSLKNLATTSHMTNAFIEYIFRNNSIGFSSKDNGRFYIEQLTKDDLEEQLLKHVVKSASAKNRLGIVQVLSTNKNFDNNLTGRDVQSLIYKALGEMDMSGIKYLLERKPQIYYGLVVNFVSERYFNFKLGQANLDEPVDGINGYYYQKIHDFYSGFRKKQNGHQR